jgi:hypothetical protein
MRTPKTPPLLMPPTRLSPLQTYAHGSWGGLYRPEGAGVVHTAHVVAKEVCPPVRVEGDEFAVTGFGASPASVSVLNNGSGGRTAYAFKLHGRALSSRSQFWSAVSLALAGL